MFSIWNISLKSFCLQKFFRGHPCPYWLVTGSVRWVDLTTRYVQLSLQRNSSREEVCFVLLHDCDALESGEYLVLHPRLHFSVTANQRDELHSSCSIQIRQVREKVTSITIGLILYAISKQNF